MKKNVTNLQVSANERFTTLHACICKVLIEITAGNGLSYFPHLEKTKTKQKCYGITVNYTQHMQRTKDRFYNTAWPIRSGV